MKSYCLLIVQLVVLNLHIFPVLNKHCTEPYLGPLYTSYIYIYIYIYIFILIEIIVQFFECKIPERVLLTGAISICKKGFQGFHTGVKLRCAACLSLQILRFEYLHYDIYHSFCMQTKIKVA